MTKERKQLILSIVMGLLIGTSLTALIACGAITGGSDSSSSISLNSKINGSSK